MGLFKFFGFKPSDTKTSLKKRGDEKEMQNILNIDVVSPEEIPAKKVKVTKTKKVLDHLKKHGNITTWEAIEKYNATRLSSIIFCLKKRGLDIESVEFDHIDIYGNPLKFVRYFYKEV